MMGEAPAIQCADIHTVPPPLNLLHGKVQPPVVIRGEGEPILEGRRETGTRRRGIERWEKEDNAFQVGKKHQAGSLQLQRAKLGL